MSGDLDSAYDFDRGRHVRIRSYICSLRKQRLPVLEYLRRALDGRPFPPEIQKTT